MIHVFQSLISNLTLLFSHPLPVHKSLWTMWQTSLSKTLFNSMSRAPMKRASTDLPLCLPLPVSSPPTFTSTVPRCTTGAPVVTPRTHPSATASASGSWPVAAPSPSTWASPATTSSATARCPQMHLSAMVLTNNFSDGSTNNTEASGASMVSPLSGCASPTGCSLSTSERKNKRSFVGKD